VGATLRKELDAVFDEYAGKIEIPNKKIDEILDILTKNRAEKTMPEWRQHLIDKGFVYPPDGKKTTKKLDFVAAEYVSKTKQLVTSPFLQENFLQENGKKYSINTCNKARDYANTRN